VFETGNDPSFVKVEFGTTQQMSVRHFDGNQSLQRIVKASVDPAKSPLPKNTSTRYRPMWLGWSSVTALATAVCLEVKLSSADGKSDSRICSSKI